jgi:hypothetical protein
MVGKSFHSLTVTGDGFKNRHNQRKYECKCVCGNVSHVTGQKLKSGSIKSCGCHRAALRSKPTGVAAFNKIVRWYKSNAIKAGRVFTLSNEEIQSLIAERCTFCNKEPNQISSTACGSIKFNGIDRIDSSKGYTIDNVQTCCFRCNEMKSNSSSKDFIAHLRQICNHLFVV